MRRTLIVSTLVVLLAASATACGTNGDAPGATPSLSPSASSAAASKVSVALPTQQMSAADATTVDDAVAGIWSQSKEDLPALIIGVWDPKKGAFVKAYGDSQKGVPATTDMSFHIGSISKAYTATTMLRLVEDGKLTLDDTITDAAPGVAKKFPAVADRTIRQLLDMHSGIPDYLNTPHGLVPKVAQDPTTPIAADTLIQTGIDLGLTPPGQPGGYSTTNYILLQEIAEEVTGTTLQELVKSEVTDPLGMTHTSLPPLNDTTLPAPGLHSALTPSCQKEFASSGAQVKLGTDLTDYSLSYGQGGGGMASTITELGLFAASGVGDAVLQPATAKARDTLATLGDTLEYGQGTLRYGSWYGHSGETLGYETLALRNPDTGVTVALASNSCGVILQYMTILAALYPDM